MMGEGELCGGVGKGRGFCIRLTEDDGR
jgi:hypothetical protein